MNRNLFSVIVAVVVSVLMGLAAQVGATENTSEAVVDRIGVKGPLKLNGTTFSLAWTAKPNEHYYAQEYLPQGETLEAFNQMLAIHLFISNTTPEEAVMQKARNLAERKKSDPVVNASICKSQDGKKYMIDFLVGETKDNMMTLVEFNVWVYEQVVTNSGEKALLVYAYSKRSYGDDLDSFFQTFASVRTLYINAMGASQIPSVTIQAN